MKPKVFVSSTIIDFEDLRGALKYFLEEYGYDVQMSEYPNFSVDPNSSAIETCIKNLAHCQYYILLIGYRRGSWFKENELSVTNLEYRAAKTLIERGDNLKIVTFVRKQIWLLKDDRNGLINHFKAKSEEYSKIIKETGSTIIDDPDYIFNFLKEISFGIKFPGDSNPVNNWIYDFVQFEDIITALKNAFQISESLEEKRLKRLLKNEFENNLRKFIINATGINALDYLGPLKPSHKNFVEYLAATYFPKLFNKNKEPLFVDKGIQLENIEANRLILIYTMILPMIELDKLETRFLERVINEGTFLIFSVIENDYDISLLSSSMTKLLEWINAFKYIFNSNLYKDFQTEMARIATSGSLHSTSINISMQSCTVITGLAHGIRIYNLIEALLLVLKDNDFHLLTEFDFSYSYYLKYL